MTVFFCLLVLTVPSYYLFIVHSYLFVVSPSLTQLYVKIFMPALPVSLQFQCVV